jgi:hypothetical protein
MSSGGVVRAAMYAEIAGSSHGEVAAEAMDNDATRCAACDRRRT